MTTILTEREKQEAKERFMQAFWGTVLIQPAVILFFWNVGIASIAHVQTFGSYWPLLAISLAINMAATVATHVRKYGR
jgi:hypothetical protein